MSIRDAIPNPLKREVRQACGFGCVVCGSPIYDYDHIDEYATVKEHTFDNLVLLCPTCHRKKTNSLLTKDDVLLAKKNASHRTRTAEDELPKKAYTLDIGDNIVQNFFGESFLDLWIWRVIYSFQRHALNKRLNNRSK